MSARILVVDDLLPNVKLLEAKLKSEFYEVITSDSGIQALEIVEQTPPDLILLDVMMPEMDGFETCKRIKENSSTSDIPVVMVTALSDVEDRVQGLNAGADDFLTKPINDLALFARIRSLVRLKSITDELKLRDQTGEQFGSSSEFNDLLKETKNAKILVVDEDVAQASQITNKLEELSMQVIVESNPHEAVRISEETEVDLIMVSTQLSTDDGLHLCTHLRSQEKTKATPLLILIEDDQTELLVKGLDMGINDYLITPLDSNEIVARVRTQIRRKRYQDALKENQQKSLTMAVIDSLTSVYNRRYFDTHLERMLQNLEENGKHISLMMIDIDHFKLINDNHGHLSGDDVLKELCKRLQDAVRPTDLVARYGGEEFSVVMPDTSLNQAAEIAERIRKFISRDEFTISSDPGKIHCTASIGVSVSSPSDTPQTLIERADKALYHVKHTGRNKVAVFFDSRL